MVQYGKEVQELMKLLQDPTVSQETFSVIVPRTKLGVELVIDKRISFSSHIRRRFHFLA
jgi:hypothetical protein